MSSPTAQSRTGPAPEARLGGRRQRRPIVLSVLFVGLPVWWVLGLADAAFIVAAVPMAVTLLRRPIVVPRGFGLWLIFLLWVAAGATVLFATAPFAVPGGDSGRVVVFGYRLAWYLACTVVLLYVGNLREEELPSVRVCRLLGYMFVVTTVGGLVGALLPPIEFTSAVEAVLPASLASNGFIQQLVHPATAEVQTILGFAQSRPIAPFPYANTWGASYSLYLPFFLLAWTGRHAGWRRRIAPLVLLVSAIPVVYSLNRGLWLALGLGALYIAVRLVAAGRIWALQLAAAGLLVGAVLVMLTPLGQLTEQRLENPHSNDRRSQLAEQTLLSTVTGSPIVGFGTTRDVQGSYFSIAGGSTEDCPACAVPPLGTQGHAWLVLFSQGLVGFALFMAFFAIRFLRHWRDPDPYAVAACVVLLFFGVEIFIYDTLGPPLFTVMAALGLAWRRSLTTAPTVTA